MKYNINPDFTAEGIYRPQHLIARGAMGEVYMAKVLEAPSEPFPEFVAIKTFPPCSDFSSKAQKREIETMKILKHPNVVGLLDWGQIQDYYFMVFPYYANGSLDHFLLKNGQLSPEEAVKLLYDMGQALSAIHERGLLHLDIKPANILIAEDLRFVLSDLGIASYQFQQSGNRIKGTPLYMSPEQAKGEIDKLDARTDLFSLGATLFYGLQDASLKPTDDVDILTTRKLVGLSTQSWNLPAPYTFLSKLIKQMLSFEAHKRMSSAAELMAELRKYMTASGVSAKHGGEPVGKKWREKLARNLGDPVLRELLSSSGTYFKLRYYAPGSAICYEDEESFDVFILLHGSIRVSRKGVELAVENRVGSIKGEVAALVGKRRTATLESLDDTVCALINGAELEQAARKIPALAVRIMKTLALHLFERDRQNHG
ncbi:MAG: hypothetical protein CSA81_10125 [Acidobacteria bacterium]|nr:MAG: hypothetical protein CSA81_10125 [Acidobacteriota bacterium]